MCGCDQLPTRWSERVHCILFGFRLYIKGCQKMAEFEATAFIIWKLIVLLRAITSLFAYAENLRVSRVSVEYTSAMCVNIQLSYSQQRV